MSSAEAMSLAPRRSFVPRDYQSEMIHNICGIVESQSAKRILGIAPTGSGKGLMVAMVCQWFLKKHRWARVLVLCHQGHLLTQNESTLNALEPAITTGVYCNGENRKDRKQQVIFASRDSLRNRPDTCGFFDGIIVDEAHLIDPKSDTTYGKIFKVHSEKAQFIVGFTGTPWRLGIGEIWGHDSAFFETVAHNIKMRELIDRGFLSDYRFPQMGSLIDTTNVKVNSTGEYNSKQLTRESNKVVGSCLDKWHALAHDRKLSIFFCCSRDHAKEVVEQLGNRFLDPSQVCYIDGEFTGSARRELISDIKSLHYKAIVNVGVMTTGFDCPAIDTVVMLRATQSVSLWSQCLGRGLRIAEGKEDCLVLDMAGNFQRFGSIEDPYINKPSDRPASLSLAKSSNESSGGSTRECPMCKSESTSMTRCGNCGHLFISHSDEAYQGPQEELHRIKSYRVFHNQRTAKGDECAIVSYHLENGDRYREWLLTGSDKKWQRRKANEKLEKFEKMEFQYVMVIPTSNPKFPRIEPDFYLPTIPEAHV